MFVARQPILDLSLNTEAYELLFRGGAENAFTPAFDGDKATMSVMNNSFFQVGMHEMTNGKRGFINCTRQLLLNGYMEVLPKEQVVIELLETIEPDEQVIEACYRLKTQGYTLALDDFVYSSAYEALIPMTDIIKVDFMQTRGDDRKRMVDAFLPLGITMLAEKVESQEEFNEARAHGYTLFQGYFFSKPDVVTTKSPGESHIVKLRLLQEVTRPDFDIQRAEDIVKHDPMLSMRLLRLINSPAFGVRNDVKSIRQALALLGQRQLRRWITILALSSNNEDKSPELLRQMIVRARFCESIAEEIRAADTQLYFMTGLFSLLDALMDQSMEALLGQMALVKEVNDAIMHQSGIIGDALCLAIAFENGSWDTISEFIEKHHFKENRIPEIHRESIQWADSLIRIA